MVDPDLGVAPEDVPELLGLAGGEQLGLEGVVREGLQHPQVPDAELPEGPGHVGDVLGIEGPAL